MSETSGVGGLTHFVKAFVTGTGRDALAELIKQDVQRFKTFTSLAWAPGFMKTIFKVRIIFIVLIVFASPLRPKSPTKYFLYRGWVLRWMYIFSVLSAGLMAFGALARTTLPRYWRYWAAAAMALLTFKACKPLPAGRVNSIQEMRDKVKDATGGTLQDCYTTSQDGVRIHYQRAGYGDKVIMICNGAGGRLHVWEPLLRALKKEDMYAKDRFTVVTWDYRGLFQSAAPEVEARLSIRDIAMDIGAVMRAMGREKIFALVGWSMGVQVGLEYTALHPGKVEHLVMLNGTHGHIIDSAMQPIFRMPWLGGAMGDILTWLKYANPWLRTILQRLIKSAEPLVRLHFRTDANPDMEWLNWEWALDIFDNSESHTNAFIVQFQELNAHSVYHHLPKMPQPALIITGMLDPLTPAYQSYELRQQLENSRIEVYTWASHFTLMEYSTEVADSIVKFILAHEEIANADATPSKWAHPSTPSQGPLGVEGTLGCWTPQQQQDSPAVSRAGLLPVLSIPQDAISKAAKRQAQLSTVKKQIADARSRRLSVGSGGAPSSGRSTPTTPGGSDIEAMVD